VTEKRGVFKSWTVLLAIAAFSLSLLGTFIIRSGLITSVHAFAVDPERGLVLLTILLIVIGVSLFLYALRAPVVKGTSSYTATSREVFLLINNILLVVSTAGILLGTLYPLLHEAINGEANMVSVGPPYFNTIFLPLMGILSVFLGVGSISRWKRTSVSYLKEMLVNVAIASVVLGVLVPLVVTREVNLPIFLAVSLAFWIVFGIVRDVLDKSANKASRLAGMKSLSLSYWGMQVAHLGFAVIILGICLTSHYSVERDVRLAPGESISIRNYEFIFEGATPQNGPNYQSQAGVVTVLKNGRDYLTLHPEKRTYYATGSVQTEADIDVGFFRDLFAALGDERGGGAWVVRIHLKPFVFWIWLGAFLMAGGGVGAILDKRYRARVNALQAAASPAATNLAGQVS